MRFPRSSGILLHPTSLPGPHGSGDFGLSAYHFIDWLLEAGQSLWQILPLGPVGLGNSPYMSLSTFAGNPLLIDLDELAARGWLSVDEISDGKNFLSGSVEYERVIPFRMEKLLCASKNFFAEAGASDKSAFETFCKENAEWLEDYALFMALNEKFRGKEFSTWDTPIARREPSAIAKAQEKLAEPIRFWKFTQWNFYRQWLALKKYANEKGVQIVGDIPIFVAYHSADVWARPELFYLDEYLRPKVVAGVPPDYFSVTGQRWGNPLYRWDVMKGNEYSWWIKRIRTILSLMDIVRIDHFRGFVGYWEIPSSEPTAEHGRWVEGPKEHFFEKVLEKLGKLPIIAEDLGFITEDVIALREKFSFPGMKILQFAFAGDTKNPFLPHNFRHNVVVYSGTHDNDTTIGWFNSATDRERTFVKKYSGVNGDEIHWTLIGLASRSVADMAVFPMQDVLGLDSSARMNFPGTPTGNWEWRFTWDQVKPEYTARLYELTALNNRCDSNRLILPEYPREKAKP
jgi:4-alpha-glucanotransferase